MTRSTRMLALAAPLVALALTGGCAKGAASAPTEVTATVTAIDSQLLQVADCPGDGPATRPAEMTLACGDGGIVAQNLEWTAWSALGAHAKGIAEVNQCTPDCARGTEVREPVTIDLSGLRVTSNGDRYFTHIAFAIPGYHSGVLPTLGG
jgi:hypothetical protein